MKLSDRAYMRIGLRRLGRSESLLNSLPRSKYQPHQGEREKARRVRQMQAGTLGRSNGVFVFPDGAEL